jgi:hypothetical protein
MVSFEEMIINYHVYWCLDRASMQHQSMQHHAPTFVHPSTYMMPSGQPIQMIPMMIPHQQSNAGVFLMQQPAYYDNDRNNAQSYYRPSYGNNQLCCT